LGSSFTCFLLVLELGLVMRFLCTQKAASQDGDLAAAGGRRMGRALMRWVGVVVDKNG
jgi:hypothetical protein